MGYGKDDELAINTIRLLAVSGSPSLFRGCRNAQLQLRRWQTSYSLLI